MRHVAFSLPWAKKSACADQIVLAESQVVQKASFSPTLSRLDAVFTEQRAKRYCAFAFYTLSL